MKIEFQDNIDDYLLNRMSGEERKSFEQKLDSDPELQDQLAFTQEVQQAITSRNEKLDAIKEWQDDYTWKQDVRQSPAKRLIYWSSGIAALLLAGFFLLQYQVGTDNNLEALPNCVERGGEDPLADIRSLLQQKRYEEALAAIEAFRTTLRDDSAALMQDNLIDETVREYDLQIVRNRQVELKQLNVQALLGLQRQREARSLQEELRQEEDSYQTATDSLHRRLER